MSWKKEKFCPEIQSEWLEICYDGSQWDGGKVMAIQSDIRNTFNKWPSVLTQSIRGTLKHTSCSIAHINPASILMVTFYLEL